MTKRKQYSTVSKARVALAAIRGDSTIAELSSRYGIDPNMISKWKRQAMNGVKASLLSGGTRPVDQDAEIKTLRAKAKDGGSSVLGMERVNGNRKLPIYGH